MLYNPWKRLRESLLEHSDVAAPLALAWSGPVVMYCERKAELPLIQLLQSLRWCRVQRVAFALILPTVQTTKKAQTDTFSRQLHKLML